jgi:large subunit ribosomal protein L13
MKNKTYAPNPTLKKEEWHFIDATGLVLGKVSTQVAKILMGKNKATFTPNEDMGDKVVITNADKVAITGGKEEKKIYYRYTGFPKGLREEKLKYLMDKDVTKVLRNSVYGMLPKNKLRKVRISNLFIYKGAEHPHTAQEKKN